MKNQNYGSIFPCLVLSMIVISCNLEKDKHIPLNVYKIPIAFIDTTYFEKLYIIHAKENYRAEWIYEKIDTIYQMSKQMKVDYKAVAMHTRFYNHLIYKNDTLEILFPRLYKNLKSTKNLIVLNCLIGVNKLDKFFNEGSSSSNCYYILWMNQKGKTIGEIDKETDTIYTNIENQIIHNLYPDFNGSVINPNITKIIVDYRISIDEKEFYYKIQFEGFNRYQL